MLAGKEVKIVLAKFDAQKLRKIRKEQKMTQSSLAEKANSTDRYIRDLESGRKNNPSAILLCQMSGALGVQMDDLMDIRGDDSSNG